MEYRKTAQQHRGTDLKSTGYIYFKLREINFSRQERRESAVKTTSYYGETFPPNFFTFDSGGISTSGRCWSGLWEFTKAMVTEAAHQGLVLLSCGFRGNVSRSLSALTSSDALINEGMDIFKNRFKKLI